MTRIDKSERLRSGKIRIAAVIVLCLALQAIALVPAGAHDDEVRPEIAYQAGQFLNHRGCYDDHYDEGQDLGAIQLSVWMQEHHKNRVRGYRVVYKLYNAETSAGINLPITTKTISSYKFPMDKDIYQWGPYRGSEPRTRTLVDWQGQPQEVTNYGSTHVFRRLERGVTYRVEAKMIWDRKLRRDWVEHLDLGTYYFDPMSERTMSDECTVSRGDEWGHGVWWAYSEPGTEIRYPTPGS